MCICSLWFWYEYQLKSFFAKGFLDRKATFKLKKRGNNNFKNNLSEFNIAETATLDIKYKSKAADYYLKYLKNEVEKEIDPNYALIQIDKSYMEFIMVY